MRIAFPATAACVCLVASPAVTHDWYEELRSLSGERCCDARDCGRVGLCLRADRHEGLLVGGVCHPIPWDKVLPVPSPDGAAHACWSKQDNYSPIGPPFRCVILPGSA